MRIGFVGLGIMGSRMAARLLGQGHELAVWNRTAGKAAPLAARGARAAPSPAEAARDAEVLFSMLSTPEAVRESAVARPDTFLPSLRPGRIWADCTTVDPASCRAMAREAAARGVRFVEAPVAGSLLPAERGELVFLAGGEAADVEEVRPLLLAMGKKVVHGGPVGAGSAMKLAVNILLGGAMTSFAEALRLGSALGVPRATLFEALLGVPAAAPFLAGKRRKIEEGEYGAEFPLRWLHKDLHLAATAAYAEGIALPVTNAMKELLALAAGAGLGEQDISAVCAFLQRGKLP